MKKRGAQDKYGNCLASLFSRDGFSVPVFLCFVLIGCVFVLFALSRFEGASGNTSELIPVFSLVGNHRHQLLKGRLEKDPAGLEDLDRQNMTAVQIAARDGCTTCVDLLLKASAKPDVPLARPHPHGYHPIHLAVIAGKAEIVELLASAGASVNATDAYDCTPLFYAVRFSHEGLVGHLLKLGANPNHRSACGWQPLHWASLMGLNDAVPQLVKAGADINDEVLANVTMEKFPTPRDQQIGQLHLTCWPERDQQKTPASFSIGLFNWSNAPEQALPAEKAEADPKPQLYNPVRLSKLLGKETITAFLKLHGGRD